MKTVYGLILMTIVSSVMLACGMKIGKKIPDQLTTEKLKMEFVYIPPGTFVMGSPSGFSSLIDPSRFEDEAIHKVEITRGFYIQKTEVTQSQWETVMLENPSDFKECGGDCPVDNVSWNDAQEFIRRLNEHYGNERFRLPTEAEWEYVCRLGAEKGPFAGLWMLTDIARVIENGIKIARSVFFSTGPCLGTDQANYNGNYPFPNCPPGEFREGTMPVGSFPPNKLGIHDLHGNVNEWCQDVYAAYPVAKSFPMYKRVDPSGPDSGRYRVYRGGSWISSARYCRAAYRGKETADYKNSTLGLRLVKTLE